MNAPTVTTKDQDQILAEQLRRRAEAARRLPPLADGRRDPVLEAPSSDAS